MTAPRPQPCTASAGPAHGVPLMAATTSASQLIQETALLMSSLSRAVKDPGSCGVRGSCAMIILILPQMWPSLTEHVGGRASMILGPLCLADIRLQTWCDPPFQLLVRSL